LQNFTKNSSHGWGDLYFTKNSSHGWGDLFVSDIHVRRSVVTSAVDWHCGILWIFGAFGLTSARW